MTQNAQNVHQKEPEPDIQELLSLEDQEDSMSESTTPEPPQKGFKEVTDEDVGNLASKTTVATDPQTKGAIRLIEGKEAFSCISLNPSVQMIVCLSSLLYLSIPSRKHAYIIFTPLNPTFI